MVKVKEDITGWKMWEHGIEDSRLIVVKQVDDYVRSDGRHEARYLCKCSCGSIKDIILILTTIKNGDVKSCGCLKRKHNNYDLSGEYGIGWTINTNKEFYFDLEDYDKIKNYCWHEHKSGDGYSCLRTQMHGTQEKIMMHQLLGFK